MHHYVYKITDTDGNFYIGSRTSSKCPQDDKYMGSGNWPRNMMAQGASLTKRIIAIHPSRKEACELEKRLILEYLENPQCMNISRSSSVPSPFWVNPWAWLLNSAIIESSPSALFLWMDVVSCSQDFGICSRVLAMRHGMTEDQCDDELLDIASRLDGDLPRIGKIGQIWKTIIP